MKVFTKYAVIGGMSLMILGHFAKPIAAATPSSTTNSATTNSGVALDRLVNPLDTTDPREIIARLIQGILSIIGSLALLMFVYGGFLWITSFGESKRIDRGKTILVWAVAGLALIASAYVLVNALILGLVTGKATPGP